MTNRCPTLSPTKPTDVAFAQRCVDNVTYVPQKHRADVIAAFELGIETNAKGTSKSAKAIVASLTAAKRRLTNVIYDQPQAATSTKANGHDTTAHDHHRQELLGSTALPAAAAAAN